MDYIFKPSTKESVEDFSYTQTYAEYIKLYLRVFYQNKKIPLSDLKRRSICLITHADVFKGNVLKIILAKEQKDQTKLYLKNCNSKMVIYQANQTKSKIVIYTKSGNGKNQKVIIKV